MRHGWTPFWERLAHRLRADGLDDLHLHDAGGELAQRPAGKAGRWIGAGQGGDSPGSGPSSAWGHGGPILGLAGQAGQPLGTPGRPRAGDCAGHDADRRLGHGGIGPGRALRRRIGEQQDAGAWEGPGRLAAGADQPGQGPTVTAGQTDDVLLAGHDGDPFQRDGPRRLLHWRTRRPGRTTERSDGSPRAAHRPKADFQPSLLHRFPVQGPRTRRALDPTSSDALRAVMSRKLDMTAWGGLLQTSISLGHRTQD